MSYELLSETEWEHLGGVWDLLESGQVEAARRELGTRFGKRLLHPDVRIVDAAIALEEGHPERASRALEGAERSADPALFFQLRATAAFDQCRFDAARDDGRRALTIRPDFADAHDLVSRTLEHLGDDAGATEHAVEAHELDPESFPLPLPLSEAEFDRLVERSLGELPKQVRRHLDEVPVMVQGLPDPGILRAEEPPFPPDLLGLFVGRDLMSRSHLDAPQSGGAIYLFRKNLLRACHNVEELEREVRITVQHEVGHLLGLDEDDLDEWGLA